MIRTIKYKCKCTFKYGVVTAYDAKRRQFQKAMIQRSFKLCKTHSRILDKDMEGYRL